MRALRRRLGAHPRRRGATDVAAVRWQDRPRRRRRGPGDRHHRDDRAPRARSIIQVNGALGSRLHHRSRIGLGGGGPASRDRGHLLPSHHRDQPLRGRRAHDRRAESGASLGVPGSGSARPTHRRPLDLPGLERRPRSESPAPSRSGAGGILGRLRGGADGDHRPRAGRGGGSGLDAGSSGSGGIGRPHRSRLRNGTFGIDRGLGVGHPSLQPDGPIPAPRARDGRSCVAIDATLRR